MCSQPNLYRKRISEKCCNFLLYKELTNRVVGSIIRIVDRVDEGSSYLMEEEGGKLMSGEDKAQAFFENNPVSYAAFEDLKSYIGEFCPEAKIAVQDSVISFRTTVGFAYVSLPSSCQSSFFTLAFTNKKRLTNPRIDKTLRPVPDGSYVYHVQIQSISDIDAELKSWIRQSYEYSRLSYLRRA